MKIKSKNKTFNTKNNSTGIKSTALLNILQRILLTGEGTITYIFEYDRYNMKTEEDYIQTCKHQHVLSQECLMRNEKEKKTPNELLRMFETTMEDLGAKRYIIS